MKILKYCKNIKFKIAEIVLKKKKRIELDKTKRPRKKALPRQKRFYFWCGVFILSFFSFISIAVFWVMAGKRIEASLLAVKKMSPRILEKKDYPPPDWIRRRIDGVYVEKEKSDVYPVAVMIDNHRDSRPPAGLSQANLVYEVIAEGVVTRFMAVFANGEKIKKIGPVRSARPYFLDWSQGLDALYVHVGGSPEALEKIKNEEIFNLNEFYQGDYFWRDENRFAPHDVFISSESINSYLKKRGAEKADYETWLYKDEAGIDERPATSTVAVDFSAKNFLVEWKYNKEENSYWRYLGGEQHKDVDNSLIKAKNIIIIKTKVKVLDEMLRRKVTTIGTGKAWYCLDGRCAEGEWKKTKTNSREKIYNQGGEEARFNAGATWIEVIHSDNDVIIN